MACLRPYCSIIVRVRAGPFGPSPHIVQLGARAACGLIMTFGPLGHMGYTKYGMVLLPDFTHEIAAKQQFVSKIGK